MTKRLILTRHAKSSWDDPAMPDHERPLNARGRSAAADLGGWLASHGYIPDEVLCSDAARTRETWERMAPTLAASPTLVLKSALFHASAEVMLAVLRHGKGDTVLMIGHNPGIADFASRLVAQPPAHPHFQRYPTAATLVASFEVDDWAQVGFGMGAARDFIVPREIVA
jgi:phosphohistidine phosphatase